MSDFTGVVSSTGLAETGEPLKGVCPRELLGLACLCQQYECLCEQVAAVESETVTSRGQASSLVLRLSLIPNMGNPMQVMTGLNRTGYKADFQASPQAVTATFNLRKPQNTGLNEFIRETGI